ncbi:MAG: hypothetical protein IJD70_09420, partial [Clostridia bacterium]|nr:hypothetical protein [Clostridia bacterium]
MNTSSGKVLSTDMVCSLMPEDAAIKAAFAKDGGTPWFGVGGATQKSVSSGLMGMSKIYYYEVGTSYLFDDLNEAATYAAGSSTKAVVLMNNGTLPAGDYTIPAGVTLLIPFDSTNTMYTTQVQNTGTYTTPTAYRTLTMADGANIILNGSMSVSAKQKYAAGSKVDGGAPTGSVGFVKMQGNSSITVNNGGALYAYGFITGSGSVTANSGASVYEMFQIADFRGGTQSTKMDNGVFPLSQYYVQNIEVPLTLYAGAIEYAYTTIYMSSTDFGSAVAFIASKNAMFNLTDGYVTKRYDGSTDRLIVDLNGTMTMSPVEMKVGTSSINSKDYDLGINGNITLNINSGSNVTIKQDVAFLPGCQVNVAEGATCKLDTNINVYIYDKDQWGNYCGATDLPIISVIYAPGRTYTRTSADIVDAMINVNGTMDASSGNVYTTAGGANIYSSEGTGKVIVKPGTQTVTYQLLQKTSTYVEIPITPVKLKNADGSYFETSKGGSATKAYVYDNEKGVWICLDDDTYDHAYDEGVITTPPTCTEKGEKLLTCTVCGTTKTEEVDATGHTDADGDGDHDCDTCKEANVTGHTGGTATCTEAKVCTECGQRYGEAKGHTPGAEADCVNAQTCTVCGEVLETAKGHTPGAEADCVNAQTCTVCGEVLETAKGHTPGAEADCVNAQTCTVCGEVLEAAKGHTPGAEADCVNAQTCTVCGEVLETAKGHTPGAEADCVNA